MFSFPFSVPFWLGGGLLDTLAKLLPGLKDIAEVFKGNKKDRDTAASANEHDEGVAVRRQFETEFSYTAANRNWFDIMMDGINRIPRPLFAISVWGIFVWCALAPENFARSMVALKLMPEYMWYLCSAVITFFFGSRVYDKTNTPSTAVPKGAIDDYAKEVKTLDRTVNPVVAEWKKRKLADSAL